MLIADLDVPSLNEVYFIQRHKPGFMNPAEAGLPEDLPNRPGIHQGHDFFSRSHDPPVISHPLHVKDLGSQKLLHAGFCFHKKVLLLL